jgi:hypothetical protein
MTKTNFAARGIDQINILQHIFKFVTPDDCFYSCRIVCKSWKHAVELIRFNSTIPIEKFRLMLLVFQHRIDRGSIIPLFFEKYFRCFKKVIVPMDVLKTHNSQPLASLIVNNLVQLNHLFFEADGQTMPDFVDQFVHEIVKNSQSTLQFLGISKCLDISKFFFSKLETLHIDVGLNISCEEFEDFFLQCVETMKQLQLVELTMFHNLTNKFGEHISTNYAKHCIKASAGWPFDKYNETLDTIPVQILTNISNLNTNLKDKKYKRQLEYIHLEINVADISSNGWEIYQEIFDNYVNLKAIEIHWKPGEIYYENRYNDGDEVLTMYSNIWKERLEYFKNRGILNLRGGILNNKKLEKQLAKKNDVLWKMNFVDFDSRF